MLLAWPLNRCGLAPPLPPPPPQSLSLHSIKHHDWHIQPCCALTGEGLMGGLDWIHQRIKQQHGKGGG
jgi:hypothetical protein